VLKDYGYLALYYAAAMATLDLLGADMPTWFWFLPCIGYVMGWGLATVALAVAKVFDRK
jgi:hypothetical protein